MQDAISELKEILEAAEGKNILSHLIGQRLILHLN